MSESHYEDKEKATTADVYVADAERSPDQAIATRFGSRFGPILARLFASGVEARGIERVPEDRRETKNAWNNVTQYRSVNTVLTTIPIGVLGQYVFALTFSHVVATILCFGFLGATATAFVATLGPKTGLRTMIITRYSSGYVGCTLYSILNIITQLGFATTAVILGGQTLASVSSHGVPLVVGIIIIGICCLIPCFVGYNMVHIYERYAWMVTFFIMCCLWGLGGKAGFDVNAQESMEKTGRALAGDVLSFGAIVFGSFSGWAPVAADYNVRLPADTSSLRVFTLTWFGLYIPICFTSILGAALVTITDPAYIAAFGPDGSTGGLIAQVLSPWGAGGRFLLVLLAFSCIANNIPNTYSAALSIQALGRPLAAVPRFLWVVFIFLVYTIAGVAGREHFSAILSNFLSILSYWTAFFILIVAEEHFIFRRRNGRLGGYNLADWDNPSKLAPGYAGILAGCFGVVGAIVGMSQVWYTGPVGEKAGADLGFELAAAFAGVMYPPLRWLEISVMGR
ncbi:permease for cytosine/purines, uracil, thiamine, allantoin-domain-containing protein [Scleroderma yunnanense]